MIADFDAVLFDCDGTLVDSVTLAAAVLTGCLSEAGIDVSEREVQERFACCRFPDALAALEAAHRVRLPPDFIPEFRRRRDARVESELRAMPGAKNLLDRLRLPVAVASNGPREQTRRSLMLTDLLPYFGDNVFSAYDLDAWKPDPKLFLHAADALGVPPSRCAVVEDADFGIEAGLAAGMTVFALSDDPRWLTQGVTLVRNLTDVARHLGLRTADPNA